MIGYGDVKEFVNALGVPAAVTVLVVSAFHHGVVPSLTTDTYKTVEALQIQHEREEARVTRHEQDVAHLIRQHAEQMQILNRSLKEICLNTAKNEARSYKCVELDGTLSAKQ